MLGYYRKSLYNIISVRLKEPRHHVQILFGPRQVGKTTLMHQIVAELDAPHVFASADAESHADGLWISQQWERARFSLMQHNRGCVFLILDEVQKVENWAEYVKKEWDDDTARQRNIKVVLLGSSSLMIQKGMTESLAGRFELIRIPHWSYSEMVNAFGLSLDQYIFFGSYPGSAELMADEARWKQYVRDALVEPAITRDVLLMTRVDKPALLRQLFSLGAVNSGKIISFNKMLGQLHDAGNTTTLSHYLQLLQTAGLLAGLPKYAGTEIRRRASTPKFQVYNNALISSLDTCTFSSARENPDRWGHYVESSVGAHLVNMAFEKDWKLYYWRDENLEVDFVLVQDERAVAIEVKSGSRGETLNGMKQFISQFKPRKTLVVGGGRGILLDEFFNISATHLME